MPDRRGIGVDAGTVCRECGGVPFDRGAGEDVLRMAITMIGVQSKSAVL